MLCIDFETRSECKLGSGGTNGDCYSRDESTEVLCLAGTFDGKETFCWSPGEDLPQEVVDYIHEGGAVHAHNASFEIAIWNNICIERYGFPCVDLEQWHCTAALAASYGLPRSLDGASKALGLATEKDSAGRALMLKMCKPYRVHEATTDGLFPTERRVEWIDDEESMDRLKAYCQQDVIVEYAIHHALPAMDPWERAIWITNERINLRGVPVAVADVESAQEVIDAAGEIANEQLRAITGGEVKTVNQVAATLKWLQGRGVKIQTLRKDAVSEALAGDELDAESREVLELRQNYALSSLGKLARFKSWTNDEGRACGCTAYYGATATGRFAGRGIQTQNIPRGSLTDDQINATRDSLSLADPMKRAEAIKDISANIPEAISSCLRSFIEAPEGREFLIVDYASIEARVLAWLAGEQRVIDLYTEGDAIGESGIVYEDMASQIYNLERSECTKATKAGAERRQMGKMAVLGCGYSMGWRAFRDQLKVQGTAISARESKRIIKAYRDVNPNVRQLWSDANQACINAVKDPGNWYEIGDHVKAAVEGDYLKLMLPSTRCLHYRLPQVEQVVAPWTVGYIAQLDVQSDEAAEWLEEAGCSPHEGGWFIPKRDLKKVTRRFPNPELQPCEEQIVDQVTFMGVGTNGSWGKKRLYGGLIVENITQATARDLLCDALLRCEQSGYETVLHVHDEIVVERDQNDWVRDLDGLERIMKSTPWWAAGCPIEVEGFSSQRYKK
jgi:DNA polymerase bacteriophage-type